MRALPPVLRMTLFLCLALIWQHKNHPLYFVNQILPNRQKYFRKFVHLPIRKFRVPLFGEICIAEGRIKQQHSRCNRIHDLQKSVLVTYGV